MADARQQKFDGSEARRTRRSVVLTLDEKIQYIAERELAAVIQKVHAPRRQRDCADPNTGAILALANWPKYNPNSATSVPRKRAWTGAVSAIYEPGSTFKLVTLAAAFDQNLIRPRSFNCENGSIVVAGHRIHDHKNMASLLWRKFWRIRAMLERSRLR